MKPGAKGPLATFGSVPAMSGAAPEPLMVGDRVGGTAAASVGNTHRMVQQAACVLCLGLTCDSARALARLEISLCDHLVVAAREMVKTKAGA